MHRNLTRPTAVPGDGRRERIAEAADTADGIPRSDGCVGRIWSAGPAQICENGGIPGDQNALAGLSGRDDDHLITFAESLYRSRQRRAHFFSQDLLGEPGWDLLLDLFIQHSRGQLISTTSACIASGVPTTTALRWISLLEQKGLVARSKAESDHRVNNIALTGLGADMVREYLAEVRDSFWR